MTKTTTTKLIEVFWESVPPAWHRTRATIRRVASESYGLTVEQFQVLRRIRRGIASVSAIAADNRTSRSSVSKAVEALVVRRLVSRSQDPDDRRNMPLALTPDGLRTMESIYQQTETWLAGRLARLSAGESENLHQALDLLQKAFKDE